MRALVPAFALLLAACQATAPVPPKPSAAASSAPKASVRPSAAATASSGLRLAAATKLRAPAGSTTKLAGTLQLDPILLARLGATRVNGGLVVANNGNRLIADAGGGIISDNGAGVLSNNGATIVANNGGGAVAVASGNLVAAAGAGFDALQGRAAGGAVAAAGGAGLAPAAGFRLAQVPAVPSGAAAEPAAGLLISVISLQTGKYLPLGEDDEGRPAYTIYTNAAGGFEVYLPPDGDRTVLIAASVPGQPGAVVKAGVLAAPAAAPTQIDEATAAASNVMRRSLAARLADLMASPDSAEVERLLARDNRLNDIPGAQDLLRNMVRKVHALASSRGVPQTADPALRLARARALAQAVTDAGFAVADPDEYTIDPLFDPRWRSPLGRPPGLPEAGAKVLPTLAFCFAELRKRAQAAMGDGQGGYTPLPPSFTQRVAIGENPSSWAFPEPGDGDWFVDVLERFPPKAIALDSPAALMDHLVDEYLAVNRTYTIAPNVTAYMLLDPTTYPPGPTFFEAVPPAQRAGTEAALAKLQGRFPALDLKASDPQFDMARRAAATPWATAPDVAIKALLMRVAFAVLDEAHPVTRAMDAAAAIAPLPDAPTP